MAAIVEAMESRTLLATYSLSIYESQVNNGALAGGSLSPDFHGEASWSEYEVRFSYYLHAPDARFLRSEKVVDAGTDTFSNGGTYETLEGARLIDSETTNIGDFNGNGQIDLYETLVTETYLHRSYGFQIVATEFTIRIVMSSEGSVPAIPLRPDDPDPEPNTTGNVSVRLTTYKARSVAGVVFDDKDRDGVQTVDESSLSGRRVRLLSGNQVLDEQLSDNTGTYNLHLEQLALPFYNLPLYTGPDPSARLRVELVDANATQTSASAEFPISTTPPVPVLIVGAFQHTTVGGIVYTDQNGNGTIDPTEPKKDGFMVYVDRNIDGRFTDADRPVDGENPVFTNASGQYTIKYDGVGVVRGDTRVTPASLFSFSQGNNPGYQTLGGTPLVGANFGVFQNAVVGGHVYLDNNGNGRRDLPGDVALPGLIVQLDEGNDGSIDHTTTVNTEGNYSFLGVPRGPFRISLASKAGAKQTAPTSLNGHVGSVRTFAQGIGPLDFGVQIGKDVSIASAMFDGTRFNVDFSATSVITAPFNIGFYQSDDDKFSASDRRVGDFLSVTPPVSGEGSAEFTIPATYVRDQTKPFWLVVADPENKIKEVNETNNLQVVRSSKVRLADAHFLGSKDAVQITTTSGGDEGAYSVGFFRSANTTFEPNSDKLIAGKWLTAVGRQTINFKPPKDDPKLPYLLAVIDPDRSIATDDNDRVRVVETTPDVRLTAKFENGLITFNTAYVTQLAETAAALLTAKKKGVAVAKSGADGVALDPASEYSLGVFFSSDKIFDALDTLVGGLKSITNSHESGSVDVRSMPPSLDSRFIMVVADPGFIHRSDYDPTDNVAVVASWDGPDILNAAVDASKTTLASAKNSIESIAGSLYDKLLTAVSVTGGSVADQIHLLGQSVVDIRLKLTEDMINAMATGLQITDAGRAAIERTTTFINDKFDTMLKPLLPKEVTDAGAAVSEQISGFVDQYIQPVTEGILNTGYTIATANPIRLELAEKILFTAEDKLRAFSKDPITGTLEFAGDVARHAGNTLGMLTGVLAAPFRGWYYIANAPELFLPALGQLFNDAGTATNAAGEYINAHPEEVRNKLVNGISDYLTSAAGLVDLIMLPLAAEKFAPRIWTAASGVVDASPSLKAALKVYKDLDAGLQKGIQRITTFAKNPAPSLAKFVPSERQIVKYAEVIKKELETTKFTRAELQQFAQRATGAEKEGYQRLLNQLDSVNDVGLLDGQKSLQQLAYPKESRTAKQLLEAEQQKIIRTRAEVIYGPADEATISAVKNSPELQAFKNKNPNLLDESLGWELTMDTFSTPGKTIKSVGADRDARLVFQRAVKGEDGLQLLDVKGNRVFERIEVPLEIWEKRAYADFHARGRQLYDGNVPADIAKLVEHKVQELQYLKGGKNGLTTAQVEDRAFAEVHNQLFTDRFHMEASAANSDQLAVLYDAYLRELPVGTRPLPKQTYANVLATKDGTALLRDPNGYSLMWREKVRFYTNDPAEAIAQAQKGIRENFDLRNAYTTKMKVKNAAGIEERITVKLSAIPEKTRGMMKLILEAPTGIEASDAVIARLTEQLKRLGARDLQSALQEVVGNVASLNNVTLPKGYSFVGPRLLP